MRELTSLVSVFVDKPENSINPAADLTPVDLAESPTASEFVSDAFQENEGEISVIQDKRSVVLDLEFSFWKR